MSTAKCAGQEAIMFDPRTVAHAKRLCAACPLRQPCREAAKGEQFGVWGGEARPGTMEEVGKALRADVLTLRAEGVLTILDPHAIGALARRYGVGPDTVRRALTASKQGPPPAEVKAKRDAAILTARDAGKTAGEIAKLVGLCGQSVSRVLSAHGRSFTAKEAAAMRKDTMAKAREARWPKSA